MIRKKIQKAKIFLTTFFLTTIVPATNTMADASSVTKPIDNAVVLLASVVASVGGIVLLWGAVKLGMAIHSQNDTAITTAGLMIGAGAIFLSGGVVVAYLKS